MKTISVEVPENFRKVKQWDWPLNKNDGVVKVTNTDKKFEVILQAAYFHSKEIKIKVIDGQLVVRCIREPEEGQVGKPAREISRSYSLPSDVDIQTLESRLTTKGQLIIIADKKK